MKTPCRCRLVCLEGEKYNIDIILLLNAMNSDSEGQNLLTTLLLSKSYTTNRTGSCKFYLSSDSISSSSNSRSGFSSIFGTRKFVTLPNSLAWWMISCNYSVGSKFINTNVLSHMFSLRASTEDRTSNRHPLKRYAVSCATASTTLPEMVTVACEFKLNLH